MEAYTPPEWSSLKCGVSWRRATAVAARYLGLECHLLLRTSLAQVDEDPGLVGVHP